MKSLIISLFTIVSVMAQDTTLPYYEIPEAPKTYTAGTVASRTIDGLGFRYYWATEGLTDTDLNFKPNDDARTSLETIEHILGLSRMTLTAITGDELKFPKSGEYSFSELRKETLENFKKASDILKNETDLSKFIMKLKRSNGEVLEFPFWNQLNGPIGDALWHVGQVVSFRRSSGNPLPKGVSLLTGTVKK